MLELSGGAGFAKKLLGLLLAKLVFAGNLDRDEAVELGIAGLPDAAELSHAELLDQLEMAQIADSAGGIRLGLLAGDEVERAAAGGTAQFSQRVVVQDLDGIAAMRAADVHADPRSIWA